MIGFEITTFLFYYLSKLKANRPKGRRQLIGKKPDKNQSPSKGELEVLLCFVSTALKTLKSII